MSLKKSIQQEIEELEENEILEQIIFSKSTVLKKRKESNWISRKAKTIGSQNRRITVGNKARSEKAASHQELSNSLLDKQNFLGDQKGTSQDIESKRSQSLISEKKSMAKSYIKERYFEYAQRWLIFGVFAFACFTQAITVNTFTPIGPVIQDLYGKSTNMVTLPALMFMIVSPPTMFLVNYISDKYGIKVGTTIGGIMLMIGTGLKLLVNVDYNFSIYGQAFSGIGNSFITNCPTKVASNWFKPTNRGLISIIFTLCLLISPTFGVMLPPFFVNEKSSKQDVWNLILFEFILTCVSMLLMIALFKETPPSPPSFSAGLARQPFLPQLKQLFVNKNYYLLLGTMGLILGGLGGFISIISFYLKPYGFKGKDTSSLILCTTLVGIASSTLSGIYIKKTRKLKFTIMISLMGAVLTFAALILVLQMGAKLPVLLLVFGLLGFFCYPAIPAIVELGAEITFPVSEPTATGFLFAAQQLIGFAIGFTGSAIVKGDTKSESFNGFLLFEIIFVMSCFLMAFVVEDFRRTRQEVKGSVDVGKKILELDDDEIEEIKDQLVAEGIL